MIQQNLPFVPVNSTDAPTSYCLSVVAKMLGLAPRHFIQLLSQHRYIFKRNPNPNEPWEAYQSQVNRGFFVHKFINIKHNSGETLPRLQARITAKGFHHFSKLALVLG
ncbi:phage antirepressor KilAC domain-containing protein [Psychrobacter ciconiae]|uniref:phage antirepressor KilAC domain-containing protein n=1 Tax=Psychrobacter ciconiae TaxID=1553449 RepID=UPI001918D75F|nr:phage antirepressor KilAC domain-containing protein [Psychrobacter ciconiae]